MNIVLSNSRRGFALLDALIAVIVVSVGLFGVAKLNSVMLASTAISKTRAEAVQLAEEKIEEIRAQRVTSSSSDAVLGVNANFQRTWTLATAGNAAMNLKSASVCVSWGDTCGGTGERQLELQSLVTWVPLSTAAAIGSGGTSLSGGLPETPTGRGREGGKDYGTSGLPAGAVINSDTGLATYSGSGKTELIDVATGKVLLTIEDGSAFSTISGKVYITWGSTIGKVKQGNINMSVVNANLRVLGSAGSVCRQYIPGGATNLPLYPSSGTTEFSYFHYTCYVGGGWWGNVAVVRFDGGDRVCLGDPNIVQTDTSPISRRPFLNAYRNYRGYTSECSSTPTSSACKTLGIGMVGSVYSSVSLGSQSGQNQHHFLLTTIKGQPSHDDCKTEESQPTLASNPFTTIALSQGGNAGLLFCLSATCPLASGYVTFDTDFVMTITPSPLPSIALKAIVDGGSCDYPPSQNTSSFVYTCQIDWTGWSGDYWSGNISFTQGDNTALDGQEITSVATGGVQPTDKVVTLGGTAGIGCEGGCIQFSSVPKDVTAFALSATLTLPLE